MRELKIICNECGAGIKILLVLLIGFILIGPVLAETGSISVLADPNNFVPTYKVKTESIGLVADAKSLTNTMAFPAGLKEILQINPILFQYSEDSAMDTKTIKTIYPGFSAQNIQEAIPSIVYQNPDMVRFVEKGKELDPFGGMQYTAPSGTYTLSVDTNGIIAALVNAIKEQQVIIDQQNQTINNQQEQINKMEERITALEKKVGI